MPLPQSARNTAPDVLGNQILMGGRAAANEPVQKTILKPSQEWRG